MRTCLLPARPPLPTTALRPPAHLPQTARLYNTAAYTLQATFAHGAPVLDATFESEGAAFTGGLDCAVKRIDFAAAGREAAVSVVGTHDAAVKCVEWMPSRGLLVSGSWDRCVCVRCGMRGRFCSSTRLICACRS